MREADVLIEMCRGQPQGVLRASKAKTAELPNASVSKELARKNKVGKAVAYGSVDASS